MPRTDAMHGAKSRADAAKARLIEQGIEPHPGPPVTEGEPQPDGVRTHVVAAPATILGVPVIRLATTCPEGHRDVRKCVGIENHARHGSKMVHIYKCDACGGATFRQIRPALLMENGGHIENEEKAWVARDRPSGLNTPQACATEPGRVQGSNSAHIPLAHVSAPVANLSARGRPVVKICPEGHTNTGSRDTSTEGGRAYIYRCVACGDRRWKQPAPQYEPTHGPVLRVWMDESPAAPLRARPIVGGAPLTAPEAPVRAAVVAAAPMRATPTPVARAEERTGGERQGPRVVTATPATENNEHAPTSTKCVGDDAAAFGNVQGLSNPEAFDRYLYDQVLPKASLHGMAETFWSEGLAKAYEERVKQDGRARMITVPGNTPRGTSRGTGCALIISNAHPRPADEERIWAREDGKAMAVHTTWCRRRLLVIIMHLPHTPEKQAAFYNSTREGIKKVYRERGWTLKERECIIMADHNSVQDAGLDCVPAYPKEVTTDPTVAEARRRMEQTVGAEHDAYRTMHPDGKSTTRRGAQISKRIDAITLSRGLLEGKARFVATQHVQPLNYAVAYTEAGTRKLKKSDHHVVHLKYRMSEIRQKKSDTPAFPTQVLADPNGRKAMRDATREELAKEKARVRLTTREDGSVHMSLTVPDPGARHALLVKRWRETAEEWVKKREDTLQAAIAKAHAKLGEIKKLLPKAKTKEQSIAAKAQIQRAEAKFCAALEKMQTMKARKRQHTRQDEECESARVVHAKVAPRPKAPPIAGVRRTAESANKGNIETSETGIHEVLEAHIPDGVGRRRSGTRT